jgi:hypothetical protein
VVSHIAAAEVLVGIVGKDLVEGEERWRVGERWRVRRGGG